jgi:Spy/CpxP family protein refolding chaperone
MRKKQTLEFFMYLILIVALCVPCSVGAFRGEGLNLTDEQKAALKEIRAEEREEITPLIEEMKNLLADMEEVILSAEEIDTGEGSDASLLSGEIIGVRTQIMEIRSQARLKSANVLTLEQREVMVEKRKSRQERRDNRRERIKDRQKGEDVLP